MMRKNWLNLIPSLVVGVGIILSTFIAMLTADSGWLVLVGPLVLALAFVGADMLDSRQRGESLRPSPGALIVGSAVLLTGLIVTLRDPNLVRTLFPVIGPAIWVTLLLRPEGRRKVCRYI